MSQYLHFKHYCNSNIEKNTRNGKLLFFFNYFTLQPVYSVGKEKVTEHIQAHLLSKDLWMLGLKILLKILIVDMWIFFCFEYTNWKWKKRIFLHLSVTLMYYNFINVPDIYVTNVWSSAGNRSLITLTVSLRITSMQSPGSTDGRCQTTECSAACISLLRLDMGRYHTNSTDLRICQKSIATFTWTRILI